MQKTERLLNITRGATCASYLAIVWMYAHWRNVFRDREVRSGDRLLEQVHLAADDILQGIREIWFYKELKLCE
ncbi:hypothetical protein CBS147333_7705 [Penicillium roqueforti]|nr:hypothetical protein CBS147333_7705 [Penicillium roqueforti]KAI3194630.1 hypothetical protein CBS147311_8535 [Penicillium roqueforti]KAI3263903.1 hypothetical protein CBS147308_8327 [Penicillium roqueforti]KAI3283596.1 hypothetical protein DTO003C3_8508 [Penicillium roqueforti]KAI3284988.1 hypothetical protein DTO002I6_8893 [Penicillium roqueforti]